MIVDKVRHSAVFGRRREPHTIIIARGDQIRHFTIRPWMAAMAGSALAAIAIGYLLATSYLVFRDDLIGAAAARQAHIQQSYEDRIAALRAQLDRVTSRQLLDQQVVESKVSELLKRQALLTQRHSRLSPILERAEKAAGLPATAPTPAARPDIRAGIDPAMSGKADRLTTSPHLRESDASWQAAGLLGYLSDGAQPGDDESTADRADRVFGKINNSLRKIETDQNTTVASLTQNAEDRADAIAQALETAGLPVDSDTNNTEGTGGPLVPVDDTFDTRVQVLDDALNRLDAIKAVAARAPIANPSAGYPVTSPFGIRRDPFLGTPALHPGIDFGLPYGTAVHPTGTGVVTVAGWDGGYGRMVEIDHGGGVVTRYGHMSKVLVSVGDHVDRSTMIGRSGNSGRSTGPHLHYEVRLDGKPVTPLPFIKAGRTVSKLLQVNAPDASVARSAQAGPDGRS